MKTKQEKAMEDICKECFEELLDRLSIILGNGFYSKEDVKEIVSLSNWITQSEIDKLWK
jgi:hypothetical protein